MKRKEMETSTPKEQIHSSHSTLPICELASPPTEWVMLNDCICLGAKRREKGDSASALSPNRDKQLRLAVAEGTRSITSTSHTVIRQFFTELVA